MEHISNQLQIATQGLEESLKKNLKTLSTGDLPRIHKAVLDAKTNAEPLKGDDWGKAIAWVVSIHGMSKSPDELSIGLLYDTWLGKYSAMMTKQEFQLAFKLHVQRELSFTREGKTENYYGHFHNFSVEWMCGIFEAYLAKRREINLELQRLIPTPSPEPTEEMKAEADKAWEAKMEEQRNTYKATGKLDITMPIQQHKAMEAKGWVKPLTEADFDALIDEARSLVVEDLKRAHLTAKGGAVRGIVESLRRLREGTPSEHEANLVEQMCYRLAIKAYYDGM